VIFKTEIFSLKILVKYSPAVLQQKSLVPNLRCSYIDIKICSSWSAAYIPEVTFLWLRSCETDFSDAVFKFAFQNSETKIQLLKSVSQECDFRNVLRKLISFSKR
jgi:hypothetical protein